MKCRPRTWTHTHTHIQCERYFIDGNYGNRCVTIICFHPVPCTLCQSTAALSCHMCDSHIKIIWYSRLHRSKNHPDINILLFLHNSYNDHGSAMLQMTVQGSEHMPLWEVINKKKRKKSFVQSVHRAKPWVLKFGLRKAHQSFRKRLKKRLKA